MTVYTVIVTYNGSKWIEECINSLNLSSKSSEIIVVDNCSTDLTVEILKAKFPHVILIEQKVNLGFGKANNIGISYAMNNNADFVFLLNQDAFVEEKTITNLIDASILNPNFAVLSPIQLEYSGNFLEYYFFKFMGEDNSRSFYSDFVLKKIIKKIYCIDFIQAAAWLLPLNTLNKIGGFDTIFFHYGEDNNYCQRVLFNGMKIGVVPNSFIRHDSHKPKNVSTKLFSEKYFNEYVKSLLFKFADINKPFNQNVIAKENKRIAKKLILSAIKLDFVKFKGYLKERKVFLKYVPLIMASRAKNSRQGSNYLNGQ